MQTLTLKNTWKNLTLIAVGALMATLIAVPFAGNASADDDDVPYRAPAAPVTYDLEASNGQTSTFTLVESNGEMVLVLTEIDRYLPGFPDDDE